MTATSAARVSLPTIAREWGRIGVTGFGGPPAHIALLRALCVEKTAWIEAKEFEDGIAATNLLPGPASTQLAIFCAWRLRGPAGALVGGVCFIAPGLVMILILSALFLLAHPPLWILGAAAGAGAAVPAIALHAGIGLIPASWKRTGLRRAPRIRWIVYLGIGVIAGATIGSYLVLVLLALGLIEVIVQRDWREHPPRGATSLLLPVLLSAAGASGLAALAWVALKVGALSYGGGFVIIPLMQHDAVVAEHWMTNAQFLNAVALGQVTPGPVVLTVAAVGYAAAGIGGALLATVVAFAPSFAFILLGARHFDRLRDNAAIQAFLSGAGTAVIGAIIGSSVPLGLALSQWWQLGVLAAALIWLVALRRGVVTAIVVAAAVGVIAVLLGAPAPH
ncbi:chromate efflux transporter [Lysinimonas soli]|uniref:Chromate efflux transporter n=1 Tax=Lysinimonas soli TaxID=1074233 RepID=A0ABW0NUZ9_9MICO